MGYLEKVESEIEELKNKMNKTGEKALKSFIKEYPNVSAVCWTQYVPYFNDGDACEFTIGEIYVLSGEVSKETAQKIADNPYYPDEYCSGELDEDGEEVKFNVLSSWGDDEDESTSEIISFISSIESTLQRLYGSYASIVISEHGIIIENFEPPC